jgi:hypothetical protein
MSYTQVFQEVVRALDRASIPYMVVGSFASNLYGTGRGTQDIDLVISASPAQLPSLLSFFPKTDYYFDLDTAVEAARRKSMFNVLDMARGWKIDFIFLKPTPYHQEAFSRRTPAQIALVPLFAATAEDVIVSKLEWAKMGASLRQIEDVAGVLKVQQGALDRPYIEKWVAELGLASEWSQARQAAGLE